MSDQLHSASQHSRHNLSRLSHALVHALVPRPRGQRQSTISCRVSKFQSFMYTRFVNTSVNVQYFFLCVIDVVVLRIRGTRVRALISKKRIEHTFSVIHARSRKRITLCYMRVYGKVPLVFDSYYLTPTLLPLLFDIYSSTPLRYLHSSNPSKGVLLSCRQEHRRLKVCVLLTPDTAAR
jgi:hypothetical protein